MPFDAFMTRALASELSSKLVGLKVDKICQPERDEVDLLFRLKEKSRLIINCTAATPYMALSDQNRENPSVPPMMCMLLRKHLSRAKITAVEQIGFDRIIRITFDSGDEMGFRKSKYLYCEMMGRGSNLIFTDENHKILAAFRQNDITTKFGRIVMVGFPFEPMPTQEKIDPMTCSKETFFRCFSAIEQDARLDLVFQKQFCGFGKLTAREIVYSATRDAEARREGTDLDELWKSFQDMISSVKSNQYRPCLVYESEQAYLAGESPIEFSFAKISQYPDSFYIHPTDTISECIETYYLKRNQTERHKQHYNDIAQILKNCKSRLEKKITAQKLQLEEAGDAEFSKKCADLIMQEMYRIKRGDKSVFATDYESMRQVKIDLDDKLSPSQNAQVYYKQYSKKKTAAVKMQEQIEIALAELRYAESVLATLQTATSATDLQQIREELSHWNYGRRLVSSLKKPQKRTSTFKPFETRIQSGFVVYIGMNNLQNDTVSTRLTQPDDMWFHVKNYHGSHVLLKAEKGKSFSDLDLEEAASLAAFYSEVGSTNRVEVDYTKGKFVKKPNGSKPGFITYKNHSTAIVVPKKAN